MRTKSSWHHFCFLKGWITLWDGEMALTGRKSNWTQVVIRGALAVVWPTVAFAQSSRPLVQAEISRQSDTAHLEFRGLKNWRYEVQRAGAKKVILSLPPIDEASIMKLQGFSDPLLQGVQVTKNGPDGFYQISFDLTEKDVDTFDYQTDDPSRLIVDFYRKNEPAAGADKDISSPDGKSKKPMATKLTRAGKTSQKRVSAGSSPGRRPAGDEILEASNPSASDQNAGDQGKLQNVQLHFGIFDSGDENYDRFRIKDYEIAEDAIISSRQNIYLPFPMLKMQVSRLDKLMEQQPEYTVHPKETRENKEARLLLALFERKRYGVFMKTYDYFIGRYPESPYMEILKNMAAHVHLYKWHKEGKADEYDLVRATYNELVQKFPESPLREHNHLILGFSQMEHGDALATLQTFQGFLDNYRSSPEIPQVRKALAEAFMILRRYDEATAQYNTIVRDFPKTAHAQEARYRLGDVQFAKGDFSQAIQSYETAIKELALQEMVYPNADFNMAEARFWQKDYKKSLNGYIRFVSLYPTHGFGGYALTRIGELLGILGADQRRVMGAFLESYFRFPNHPGAKIARIRMLSQQMKGMKATEAKKAVEEIERYSQDVDLPRIREFTTLMTAEGLANRKEYREAIDTLISYYQKNPSLGNLESYKARILRNMADEIKDLVDKGNFMQALQFYLQYSNTWLKNSERIDVPYFVAGAYEHAGAFSEAESIYREALGNRMRIVGTDSEKEKKVQEHLPSVGSLHLRLASTLTQDRDYIEAHQHLKAIGKGGELTPPEVIERVQLSALIAEKRNEPSKAREALSELAKEWQGDPALVAPVNLQLAQTYMKLGEPKQAETYADKVLKADGGEMPLPDKLLAEAYFAKGDALLAEKKPMAAVESYQKLLERFEGKMPLANVRYRVGQILFEHGDLKAAREVWKRLEGSSGDFLWKIGREKLEDSKWRDDYSKYISRIPAVSARGTRAPPPAEKETKP